MKRRTAQNLRCYLFASVILFSIVAGFVMSPNNLTTQPTGNGGQSNNKPLVRQTPSYNTPGCVFYDDFSGSSLGSDWIKNPRATALGATFDTAVKPGFLRLHSPSLPDPNYFNQWPGDDRGAYAYVTLGGKLASMPQFTIETKVNYTFVGSNPWYHLGIIMIFSNNPIHMYMWGPWGPTRPGVDFEDIGNSNWDNYYALQSPPSAYYMRIIRNQTQYSLYVSTDGNSWTLYRTYTNGETPTGVGVIIKTWSWGSPPYADITADFDYFKVSVDAEIDQSKYPTSSIFSGQPATIFGHMRNYYDKTPIQSGGMGFMVDGSLDQVRPTNSTGWANFTKTFSTSGAHTFKLIAYNKTSSNLYYRSVLNQTFSITWIGFTLTVHTTNYDGDPVSGATVRLKNATDNSDLKTPKTTNATGYCSFTGVLAADQYAYNLNVFQQLYNSSSSSYYNKTFPLGVAVDRDITRSIVMNTTRLTVHVIDSSVPSRPYQGAMAKLLNGTGAQPLIAANPVNLTAWTVFILPIGKNFNLTIYYGGSLKLIVTVNGSGPSRSGYALNSNHRYLVELKASEFAAFPTILTWRGTLVTTKSWNQSFLLSIWLSNNTEPSYPYINATKVNCTVGVYNADFVKNGTEKTGNYYAIIPARLIGRVPSGSTSATFTLTIDAFPEDIAYARPPPLTVLVTVKAVNLTATYSNTLSPYWSSSVALWVQLSYLNGTRFNGGSFLVDLDGITSSYAFTPVSNGFYNLTSANAFGLPVGNHTFQLTPNIDNYTLVGLPAQTISIRLSIQSVLTSPLAFATGYYNETLQPQLGYQVVYWNWKFTYNITYLNALNGTAVRDGSVYVAFSKGGHLVIETIASYNSTTKTYIATLNTTTFSEAGNYLATITASKTGYVSKSLSDILSISWRPMSIAFSSQVYDSLKGLFGGDSSMRVELTLRDQLTGSLLTGANVTYTWAYGRGNLTEIGGGVYAANISAAADVPVGQYSVTITILKIHHEQTTSSAIMNVDFAGGHVVLPLFGVVPISMFAIILGAVAVVGSIGGLRAYVWATTPYLVKQINKALHAISKEEQAEPIEGLRTRIETPLSLLLPDLAALGISLEKEGAAKEKEVRKKEKQKAKLSKVKPKAKVTEEAKPKAGAKEAAAPKVEVTKEVLPNAVPEEAKQEKLEPSETGIEKEPSPPAEAKEKPEDKVGESSSGVSEQDTEASKGPSEEEKRDEGGN